jgi:hypothetical protein
MTSKAAIISYDARARLFWSLLFISLAALGLYIFSVNAAIRNTANRQALETEVSQLNSELGTLEFRHIELKNSVSIDMAYEYGFKEVKSAIYVSRTPASALTLNTTR